MKERPPKPNWQRRVAITMAILGAIGTVATIADTEITNNAIDKNVDRTFPQIASSEELARARETITTYDKRSHILIQQGKSVINIPEITDPSELQQSITLVREYDKRQQKRSELQTKQHKRTQLDLYVGTGSLGLAVAGISVLITNRRKPTETLRQTNLTT